MRKQVMREVKTNPSAAQLQHNWSSKLMGFPVHYYFGAII